MHQNQSLITSVFSQAAVERLSESITGRVILPADPEYEEARLAWNRTVVQHPALIVAARTAQDVQAAVDFARQHELGVAVQATGHGNVRPADDCLLILTHKMDAVEIDPVAQTASMGAGVMWGAVLAAAQQHGLAPLLGSSPMVGAVGYTLGGGLGWLGRKYGLSTDHVLQFELVTADGKLRRASASENPELFWGLRGGGGSLGIITRMTIRLFPVREVYAGNLFYPASMAAKVFRQYRMWIEAAPDELTSSVLVMNFPPLPQVPDFLRGQSFAIVRGCYCGDSAEGEKLVQQWRTWQPPLMDAFQSMPFSQEAAISSDPVDPLPGYSTGVWLRELSDAAIDTIVGCALSEGGPSPLSFAEVRHAGGAVRRGPREATVYGNRDSELLLSMIGIVPTPEARQHLVAYTGKLKETIGPALSGGVYLNFTEGVESQQRIRDALVAGGYERLARLKAQLDPQNLFRFSHNVTPAG